MTYYVIYCKRPFVLSVLFFKKYLKNKKKNIILRTLENSGRTGRWTFLQFDIYFNNYASILTKFSKK